MNLGDLHLMSQLIQRQLGLDPPLTRDLIVERELPVPMPDGTVLLADRWAPRTGGDSLPVALMRCPYGRGAMYSVGMVRPLAERGFQVILQSARGTFGSGGTFEPMRNERQDGLATLDWLVKQPWFGGSIVLVGPSYLGYVQWAMADRLPPEVKAMIPQVTESALTLDFLRPDAFALETPFGWGVMVDGQERRGAMLRLITGVKKNEQAMRTLPLGQADVAAVGHHTKYIQDILAHDADDPYWASINHRDRVAEVTVPVSSIGGWYDIFLPGQLRDFMTLQEAGRTARLTIGPWTHLSMDGAMMREAIEFGLACARGEELPPRKPVRLYVMGENAWHEFESWPPPGYPPRPFYLGADGALAAEPPGDSAPGDSAPDDSAPDAYRYDPADPTPAVGGVRMVFRGAGRVENAKLEARPDVLTYTTAPLDSDVEVVGEVSAAIWFQSSLPHADVFVRLCDVDPHGKSWNICDGLTSVSGADELARVTVRLWPTAYRFKRGHRIRVQVASGAFPRYARNPGTGEPRAAATRLLPATQSVYHDGEHPSSITLPVRAVQA
jgi:putative CocE/NonD family hydrolase